MVPQEVNEVVDEKKDEPEAEKKTDKADNHKKEKRKTNEYVKRNKDRAHEVRKEESYASKTSKNSNKKGTQDTKNIPTRILIVADSHGHNLDCNTVEDTTKTIIDTASYCIYC